MLSDLPQVLSGEQVRRVLHIGKRKCAWILNNGFIKCQISDKKTRKYTVFKDDLIAYIEDSANIPKNMSRLTLSSQQQRRKIHADPDRAKQDFLPLCRQPSARGSNRNSNPFPMHSPYRRSSPPPAIPITPSTAGSAKAT